MKCINLVGWRVLLGFDVHEPVVFNINSQFAQAFGKPKVLILASRGIWPNFLEQISVFE